MTFTHLHVHSHYSMLDGMSKIPDLVNKCLDTGMNAIALTDHGNMFGIKEFLDYCKKINKKNKDQEGFVPFKPIVGVEAYCARRSRKNKDKNFKEVRNGKEIIVDYSGWHLILLAKNKVGYRNLCKLVSASYMEDSFYGKPRIDKDLLEQYHEGIICSSACLAGEVPQKILQKKLTEAEESIKWFKNLFGDDYYLELQRHHTTKENADTEVYEKQKIVVPMLVELGQKLGVKVIATNDVHFVEEEHAEAHDRLICLSTGRVMGDSNRMHYTKQEWLKTPEEMAEIFQDIPQAIANTQEIADKVEIYDIDSVPLMPVFPIPQDFGTEEEYRKKFTEQDLFNEFTRNEHGEVVLSEEEANKKITTLGGYDRLYRIKLEADYLEHLTMEGAKKRYGDNLTPEVLERIKFELHVMKTMGFPSYFLIVADYIRAAREELDVSVGPGRGSAAGSVVAYCLRITDLDPLEYNLLFERFLNPDRISLPDIDTDFDDYGREKVLDWVTKKYGVDHVAHIITYGTMAAKSAIADVGRVQQIPLTEVNRIKKLVPYKLSLAECYEKINEFKEIIQSGPEDIKTMLHYAAELEGTNRQVGIHACGVIIGPDDLTNFAPLATVEDKETGKRVVVTEYDGHVIESVGLIKMDFLGLTTLTIIKDCLALVQKTRGIKVDIDAIPHDDQKAFQLFRDGLTQGIFQFESDGMRHYLKSLQPTSIDDLIAMNALYRPGPMDYIPSYIKRKHGQEKITYDIPIMEQYLKDTYGITVYQEQVMQLSQLLAGFTRGQADTLRKAMGKKIASMLEDLKPKFLEGGKKNGHAEDKLNKIWADWEKFAEYAFNKSHAACYAWIAYQTAYLKAHYTAEFLAANLTNSKNNRDAMAVLLTDCKTFEIPVLPPDINESEVDFTVNEQGAIRFGLSGVKGVGEKVVDIILAERNKGGKYKDIYDFVERATNACNKGTMESLTYAGAFDSLGCKREQLVATNEQGEYMIDVLTRYGSQHSKSKEKMEGSLFGDMGMQDTVKKPTLPTVKPMPIIEKLNKEKEMIEVYLSAHPLDDYIFEIQNKCDITTQDLQYFDTWRAKEDRISEEKNSEIFLSPQDWIKKYENKTLHIGGLIISGEKLTSKKGALYGKYTLADYSGNWTFNLFGDNFKNFNHLLAENTFVYITGIVQQRNKDKPWFKENKFEEADYEFAIKSMEKLEDVLPKYVNTIVLRLKNEIITDEWMEEFEKMYQSIMYNPKAKYDRKVAPVKVQFQVKDQTGKNTVQMQSTLEPIVLNYAFYTWLKQQDKKNSVKYKLQFVDPEKE